MSIEKIVEYILLAIFAVVSVVGFTLMGNDPVKKLGEDEK